MPTCTALPAQHRNVLRRKKVLQIVQKYPAALSNTIQVLLQGLWLCLQPRGTELAARVQSGAQGWAAGMAPRALGQPWGHCWSETQTKSTPRAYQRAAPPHCFLLKPHWEGIQDPQEFTHFAAAFWCPTDRTQSWEAPAPKPDPWSLVHLLRVTEHRVFLLPFWMRVP